MPRTVKDARFESRTARARLGTRHEPYWRMVDQGMHLGYRRGTRSGTWIARWRGDDGRYRKTSIGLADDHQDADGEIILDFGQAQAMAQAWFARQHASDPDHLDATYKRAPRTVSDALDDYLCRYRIQHRDIANAVGRVENHIRPQLGHLAIASLTTSKILAWRDRLTEQPPMCRTSNDATEPRFREAKPDDKDYRRRRRASANKALSALKAALNAAHELHPETITNAHAWQSVKPFAETSHARIVFLDEKEARRLIAVTPDEFRPMVEAALHTGARYGELRQVQVGDFDAGNKTLHLRHTKNGKPRSIPLTDEAIRFFRRHTINRDDRSVMFLRDNGQPWKHADQTRPMKAAAAAAGTPGATFHVLRHTYASLLIKRGVPLKYVSEVLGHSDSRITERHYAHLAPDHVADTIRRSMPRLTGRA